MNQGHFLLKGLCQVALPVIESICAGAITRGNRRIYCTLNEPIIDAHRQQRLEKPSWPKAS